MNRSIALRAGALIFLAASCSTRENMPPVIEVFEASPSWGESPLATEFFLTVSDPENDPLECSLDFDGDGAADRTIEGCAAGERVPYVFNEPGRFLPQIVVSDGRHEVVESTEIFSNHLVFADNVVFPEKMEGFREAQVDDDGVILTFEDGAPSAEIGEGDILWGTSGFGYIRKVVEISISGNELSVQTSPARVEDALVSGIFGVRNYPMQFDNVLCLEDCEYVEDMRLIGSKQISSEIFPLEASMAAEFDFGEIPLGDGVVIKPKLHVSITILRFVIDMPNRWTIRELTLDVSPSIKGISVLEVPLGGVRWSREIPLGGRFAFAAVPLGPIVIVPNLEPKVRVELGLEPRLTVKVEAGITVTGGISYRQGEGTSAHVSVAPEFDLSDIDVDLGIGDAKVSLIPGVSFLLFGLLGPFVDPAVYVKSSLGLDLDEAEVCVSGKAGAEARLGVELDLFFTSIQASRTVTAAEVTFFNECFGGEAGTACPDERCDLEESCTSCPDDCGACPSSCGSGGCEPGETCINCPADCGACPPSCPNGACDGAETCTSCPADCSACPPSCDNGTCESGETCSNCPADCDACPDSCPDGTCDGGETCSSCPEDCEACPPSCGNAACEPGETCTSCPVDCGACPASCPNGACDGGENCSSCPSDCGDCPCTVEGHMGDGVHGLPCSVPEAWRCIHDTYWGLDASQVCRDGIWQNYRLSPVGCSDCCGSYSVSCCHVYTDPCPV